MNLLNPYSYIGGAVIVAAIVGSFYVQSTLIHKWHSAYDTDQIKIGLLQQKIKDMTTTQNQQTGKTEGNVIRVVQGTKELQPIINNIRVAPSTGVCPVPNYPPEVKDAF